MMNRWIGVISAVGALFVVFAVTRMVPVLTRGGEIETLLIELVLFAGPGIVLLYGGYWLPRTNVNADLYPRVAGWCLGGMGVMLGIAALLELNPAGSLDRPIRSTVLAAALGSAGGFGAGLNEVRAITRAREAENARVRADLAERRNRYLNEFTSIVSHDIRGPLRGISNSLTFLKQQHGEDFDEDAREFLDLAIDGTEEIDQLLDDLLLLTRAERVVEDPSSTELTAVIEEAWSAIDTREATLEVECEEFVLLADEERLKLLLTTLFRNAVEHSGPDVTVRAGRLPDGFYVTDDGPGIPVDDHERVFDSDYAGTGDRPAIALSIVERIAEAHDWNARFVTPDSEGTRCEITAVERPESASSTPG